MAFSFSNAASSHPSLDSVTNNNAGANVKDGPDLQEIQTNELGFAAINGESKVQLLPAPWPVEDLPHPSSSLLSVASSKGLLAAAGPDGLYIASTSKIRDAFQSAPVSKDNQIRPITPEIRIPLPRLSHVAFSSDDSVLVAATERDGHILAFQVDHVQKGQIDPALQISTNSLRALVPNPSPELAATFACITAGGDLILIDLKAGSIVTESNGPVLASSVSCLSWSNRGRQLVAGMVDGTAVQLKRDGTVVAQIPKPTFIPPGVHVSGISWLENETFFVIYTPNDTSNGIQPSEYYIINREAKTNYTFQKLPEVLPPFGVERLPSSHFIIRLRNFLPHLLDLLVVSSTTSTDVGLIARTDKPLSQEDQVTGSFTFTTIEDDTRRAQLPLSMTMEDTSPIGMVLDLSSSQKVPNPIPSDGEILETVGPVPNLSILNNEGVLVSWWIIHNESVRQKTTFSGFDQLPRANLTTTQPSQPPSTSPSSPTSPFAETSKTSSFAKPATSTFGIPTAPSGFGVPPSKPFDPSSPIASEKQSWTSTGFGNATASGSNVTSFGKPAFGLATPMGNSAAPAFGSSSFLGSRPSPFGQPASLGGSSTFGQPSPFGASAQSSPFASASGTSSGSGFASFSKGEGFSSFAGDQSTQSPFGAARGTGSFGQPSSSSTFGSIKASDSPFAAARPAGDQNALRSTGTFQLQSSFRGDGSAQDDLPRPKEGSGFGFGPSFHDLLGETKGPLSPTHDQETEMGEESETSEAEPENVQDTSFRAGFSQTAANSKTLVTPPATLTQSKVTPAPPVSNLFSTGANETATPQPQSTTPGWSFGSVPSTTPKETPVPSHMSLFGAKTTPNETPAAVQASEPAATFENIKTSPEIKEETPSDDESVDLKNIPEAPLPPDPVSKPGYSSGDTSISSDASKTPGVDAPLPPDFLPVRKPAEDNDNAAHELPSDDEAEFSSDFEGSEEDITEEVPPEDEVTEDQHDQLQTSPESSFKSDDKSPETSPTGGLFTKVSSTALGQKPARPLFGEVGTGPVFAPPKPQESPRSPSPVRRLLSTDGLRVDPSRSVSAPAHPRSIVEQKKTEYQKSALAAQAAKMREEEVAKENARREAIAKQKAEAEAQQLVPLQDDEDERLRQELERPITPTQSLDDFITYQPRPPEGTNRTGIPAQIERLYSDINSMVYTLGINCRSLSAFMRYQQPEATNQSWPSVLKSETPMDALNDEWCLTDISRLHEGLAVLSGVLADSKVEDFNGKIQQCQALLGRDLFELRTKLTSIRKTIHALSTTDSTIAAPLSAEQTSIQHDLRKTSASVQTKLVQVEDCITVLRAKLAQSLSTDTANGRSSTLSRAVSQKKPTVEAVTKTVGKMMSMAEQKSADIDVLEAQLKKMDLALESSGFSNGNGPDNPTGMSTPQRNERSINRQAPGSAGSIYHTPDSKFGSSVRSNKGARSNRNGGLGMISTEDKQRWQAQIRRRKQAADVLKQVLEEKRQRNASWG